MDRSLFEKGYGPEAYVGGLRNYRSMVKGLLSEAEADPGQVKLLQQKVSGQKQPVRATVTTEDWCGDSALNIPILADLFGRAGIELRIFRGSETPELKEKYESEGVDHIPVLSLWDGDNREIGRWIEAPAAIVPMKDEWKAARPEFMTLYAQKETDPEAAGKFAKMYREFLEEMARWYRNGMWKETGREVIELLS
jgi:Thioredoxin